MTHTLIKNKIFQLNFKTLKKYVKNKKFIKQFN